METLRTSSYMIPVKLESENGKYMLIHGYTGAIDVVSEELLARINALSSENDLSEDTLQTLLKRGYVTTKTKEEEYAYIVKIADLLHRKNKVLHNYFGFLISYDCNFRCPYCYEAPISNNGKSWSKYTFTKQMVDRVYETMLEIEHRKELHQKNILLYGGEPLLKENKEIVTYIAEKGKTNGYKFSAITNGYDLDAYKDLLFPELISSIQVTIDGTRELHDQRRIHYEAGKSFDKIIENISIALEQGVHVSVRINIANENFEEITKLKQIFTDRGYTDSNNFRYYTSLLIDYAKVGNSDDLTFMNRKEYNDRHRQYNYEHNFDDNQTTARLFSALKNKSAIKFDANYCAAHFGSYLFDPYGNIYGCWEQVGNKSARIGTYMNSLAWSEKNDFWHKRNIGISPKCSKCKYAFLCRGGCMTQLLKNGKNIYDSNCDYYSDTFKASVNKAYNQHLLIKKKLHHEEK